MRDRNALYPSFGYLYPEGVKEFQVAWNDTAVRAALRPGAYGTMGGPVGLARPDWGGPA